MIQHTISLVEEQVGSIPTWRAVCSCKTFRSLRCQTEDGASIHGMMHLNDVDIANASDIAP